MTKQEAFNIVWEKITEQGCRSMDSKNFHCRYRGEGGRKCALGHLIPDNEYTPQLEKWIPFKKGKPPSLQDLDDAFLEDLQKCHDYAVIKIEGVEIPFLVGFHKKMRILAEIEGLTCPE